MHRGLVGAAVEAGLRIVDAIAGEHDLALDEHAACRRAR